MSQGEQLTQPELHRLSILIPVYNEQYFVEQLVERVLAAPLPPGVEREVIVVDDGSADATPAILARLAARYPRTIKVYSHPINQGKGAAVRTAIQHATGDLCLIQDADLEYDPRDYSKLILPILEGDADVVYGSRFLPAERRRVLYFWHSLGNQVLTTLSNLFTDLNLTDMETCYKAAKTNILKSIPIRSNRFNLEPELTAKFAKCGCRIYEVPISYRGRSYEEGKKITWRDGAKALWAIVYYNLVDSLGDEGCPSSTVRRFSPTPHFDQWMVSAIKPFVGEQVLEIGAGIGNLTLKIFPRFSYMASDLDPLHLDYLKSRFQGYRGMEVRRLDPTASADFEPLREHFDTAICLNGLEQVADDEQALRNLYHALMPGGIALVRVPQGQWLYGSLDRTLGHYRRYSRAELSSKAAQAGFAVERLFSFNRIGLVPWLLNGRLLRRTRLRRWQLKLFDSLVWVWRRIDGLLPWPGLSLIAVLRKPQPSRKG